jgi:hypothetical protein
LVDGIGDTYEIAKQKFGKDVKIKLFTQRMGPLASLLEGGGIAFGRGIVSAFEDTMHPSSKFKL